MASCKMDLWSVFQKWIGGNTSSNFERVDNVKEVKIGCIIIGYPKVNQTYKLKHKVFENIASALNSFGRSKKRDDSVARRVLQIEFV